MPARKRNRQEAELDSSIVAVETNETLARLRNMWQFAALMQYAYIFGKAVKIDQDFDMEDLEHECLRPEASEKLAEIGLALLKFVSSHRGLSFDTFDEYTRRQFVAKAPQRNPFGTEDTPNKFAEFDVFTKIRVLHQLSTWTLNNSERMRALMEEKDNEQTQWRIEELGWDSQDRSYYVLDDDRLYRRTDAPLPPVANPKSKARKSRASRASKRIKLDAGSEVEGEEQGVEVDKHESQDVQVKKLESQDDGFGGMKWECIAVTHADYTVFLESLRKSRDPNEKVLIKRINEQIMPILEKRVEAQRQKMMKKQRELENLQKMASAKRSSRIAGRREARKAEEEAAEAEKRRQAELMMARKEREKQTKMEHARESRMLTREQRLKEREVKRILHQEELRKLEENHKNLEMGVEIEGRLSERHLKAEMERRQKELHQLAEEEGEWVFDCAVCGKHGQNYDDGTHSIACEKCNIWQHSQCHGIHEKDAEKDDFHFVCAGCCQKMPKLAPLHLHFPPQKEAAQESPPQKEAARESPLRGSRHQTNTPPRPATQHHHNLVDGPSLSPSGQSPGPPGYHRGTRAPLVGVPQQAWNGTTLPPPARPSSGYATSPPPPTLKPNDPDLSALHAQAHAAAVSAHSIHPPALHPNALHMGPPSPTKSSRPSSSHASSEHHLNGSATPHHPHPSRSSLSPSGHRLFQSPNTSFPPPALPQQQQRAAAHSPTKQPSSSPSNSQTPFHTPASNPSPYTYQNTSTSAATSILRPTPHMQSSPLPPLPMGNTPLIPTKHDTPHPMSRDSMAETPVVPPTTALSPSPAIFMPRLLAPPPEGIEGVETSLGVGSVPVKRMPPPSASQESEGDISMGDI